MADPKSQPFFRQDDFQASNVEVMPDWTRASEGFKTSGTFTGAALDDAGKILLHGAKDLDAKYGEYVKEVARDTAAADEILHLGIDQGRFSPAMTEEIKNLKDRHKAATNGAMSMDSFNLHLLSEVKRLKQNYPGHQEKVDEALRGMGYNPAQDVLRDRQNAIRKAQAGAASQSKRDQALADWALKNDPISHNTWAASGLKGGADGLRMILQQNGIERQKLDLENKYLDNKLKRGAAVEKDVSDVIDRTAGLTFNATVNSLTGGYASIQDNIKRFSQDVTSGDVNSDNQDQIVMKLLELKNRVMQETRLALSRVPGSDLYPDTVEKAIQRQVANIDNLSQAIVGKDVNVGSLLAALTDNSVEAHKYQYASDPAVMTVESMKSALGAEEYKAWATQNTTIVEAANKARVGDEHARVVFSKGSDIGNIKTAFSNWSKEGVRDPAAYSSILSDMSSAMTASSVPARTKARVAQYLFGPENKGFYKALSKEDQVQVFARLNSTEMRDAVESLSEITGNPSIWRGYVSSLGTSWGEVNEERIRTLMEYQSTTGTKAAVDPTTGLLTVVPERRADGTAIATTGVMNTTVNDINVTLRPLVAVMEKRKLPKPQIIESINNLLKGAGVDLFVDRQPSTRESIMKGLSDTAKALTTVRAESAGQNWSTQLQGTGFSGGKSIHDSTR